MDPKFSTENSYYVHPSNQILTLLDVLSSAGLLRLALQRLYLASLNCISQKESTFLSDFAHVISKCVYHKEKDTLLGTYTEELRDVITMNLPSYGTYSSIKITVEPT
jgi:hypothetical protein